MSTASQSTLPNHGSARERRPFHTLGVEEALNQVGSSRNGMDPGEAARRLAQHGPNELVEKRAKGPLRMLAEQFANVMILILFAAAALSLGLGKHLEAAAILTIVVLFAFLGFFQEYRAEKAIAALKRMSVPRVRALRGGSVTQVPARELVPGDVILLEAGNVVPADVRILESASLKIQEAALTGESEPIEKMERAIPGEDVPLGDRRNLGFLGTTVTYGRGSAVVVGTGMNTELGRIAGLIQSVTPEPTPLQRRLDQLGKQLALAGGVVALLILGIGLAAGEAIGDMLLTAISVAVAVIPEGLPAVVTFTLALGAQRMLRRNALIRKLPAVETLGSVTVICSDKTGTLTENRMTVTQVVVPGKALDLAQEISRSKEGQTLGSLTTERASIAGLLSAGALCNDSIITEAGGSVRVEGDPTETALTVLAQRGGLDPRHLANLLPRVAEIPFDSERKRMSTVHRIDLPNIASLDGLRALLHDGGIIGGQPFVAFCKGAPDSVLQRADRCWSGGKVVPMDDRLRQQISVENERLASQGMRVLALAGRGVSTAEVSPGIEENLVHLGLVGIIDPPRPEVRDAVRKCRSAGIRPIMITGDHPLTASFIARDLGIAEDATVVTGTQLAAMSKEQLSRSVLSTSVFARVSPEHKLRIVEALRAHGQVVAMTGDGVNDAPALKQADIGVAMGITGTDVSKEASDMVLRDDNFATIVAAVEEGRVIYDNLRRFVKFAIAGNIGKVAVMLLWPVLFMVTGTPLTAAVALLPLQLLWLNLMTDGLLGLSMGVEAPERNVMSRPPHRPSDGIFSGGMGWHVLWVGIYIGVVSLGLGFWYYSAGSPVWQTVMFTTLAFVQVFHALAVRSNTESLFSIGVFSNRLMWGVIAFVTLLQLAALYTPLAGFLGLAPLALGDLLLCLAVGASMLGAVELEKVFLRRRAAAL